MAFGFEKFCCAVPRCCFLYIYPALFLESFISVIYIFYHLKKFVTCISEYFFFLHPTTPLLLGLKLDIFITPCLSAMSYIFYPLLLSMHQSEYFLFTRLLCHLSSMVFNLLLTHFSVCYL